MVDDRRLVRPIVDVRESYLEAAAELRAAFGRETLWTVGRVASGAEFDDAELATETGFAAFVEAVRSSADPDGPLRAGYVHDTALWLVDFGDSPPRYLGRLSLRHELTEFLRSEGGHIGYVIRPSAQRKGLGTRMLAMALPWAAALGIESALITCDDDNAASAKVILGNGGVEDEPYRAKRRFWVPTRPRLAHIEPDLPGLLVAQLDALLGWADELDSDQLARPSVLDGWTVADLLAHLVRTADTLVGMQPSSEPPLTIAEYTSAYAAASEEIAEGTRVLAAQITGDRLGAMATSWRYGLDALAELGPGDQVVRVPRGPILRSDFLATRLLELVVHADDLGRSLGRPAPLVPSAVDLVAATLIQVWCDRWTGVPIALQGDNLGWIRLACGRITPEQPTVGLPLL